MPGGPSGGSRAAWGVLEPGPEASLMMGGALRGLAALSRLRSFCIAFMPGCEVQELMLTPQVLGELSSAWRCLTALTSLHATPALPQLSSSLASFPRLQSLSLHPCSLTTMARGWRQQAGGQGCPAEATSSASLSVSAAQAASSTAMAREHHSSPSCPPADVEVRLAALLPAALQLSPATGGQQSPSNAPHTPTPHPPPSPVDISLLPPSLTSLSLHDCSIVASLPHLPCLPSLEDLTLSRCDLARNHSRCRSCGAWSGDPGINSPLATVLAAASNLQSLAVLNVPSVSQAKLSALVLSGTLPALTSLDFMGEVEARGAAGYVWINDPAVASSPAAGSQAGRQLQCCQAAPRQAARRQEGEGDLQQGQHAASWPAADTDLESEDRPGQQVSPLPSHPPALQACSAAQHASSPPELALPNQDTPGGQERQELPGGSKHHVSPHRSCAPSPTAASLPACPPPHPSNAPPHLIDRQPSSPCCHVAQHTLPLPSLPAAVAACASGPCPLPRLKVLRWRTWMIAGQPAGLGAGTEGDEAGCLGILRSRPPVLQLLHLSWHLNEKAKQQVLDIAASWLPYCAVQFR
ncbi:hypothetical protein V8C86DRAFT_2480402 [Haematococcus lacustris]